MPENNQKNFPDSPSAAQAGRNKPRHGYSHAHGGRNGQRGEEKFPQGKVEKPLEETAAEARPPRQPFGNRPRTPQNNNGGEGRPQNGKGRKPDKNAAAGKPASQKQNGFREERNKAGGFQESGQRKNRPDRGNRRKERQNDALPQETPLTDSFEDIALPRKEDAFLSLNTAEDDAILDAMPVDATLDAVFADPVPDEEPAEGTEIVGIHFPQGGKVYYFNPMGIAFPKGSYAIVETARGLELGEVAIANRKVPDNSIVQPLKPVTRQATREDIEHAAKNAEKETEALTICKKKIEDHKLDMKLTGAQYTFDNAKLIFYFTAAQRVDFRELVKDLASTFHTRIELRQIGSRDEAKMVGGIGLCGRPLCCTTFLPNFCQSTIKMAKHQGLGLNAGKTYGLCGRPMCCLKFEESTYVQELALMPTVGSRVETPDGAGAVTDVRPIGYFVRVKLDEKADAAPKLFRLADIKVLERADEKKDEEPDMPEEEN